MRGGCVLIKKMYSSFSNATKHFFLSGVLAGFALLSCASSASAQPSCSAVFEGLDRVMTTPTHIYSTLTQEKHEPKHLEGIYAGGSIYQKKGDQWEKVTVTAAQAATQERNDRARRINSCRVLRQATIDGQDANVYEMVAKSDTETTTSLVWISRTKGRLLKQEIDIDDGKGTKLHYSSRYEYDKVEAPL
jgi:hypothetical protein